MKFFLDRIEREKLTVEKMIHIFCELKHNGKLCSNCTEMLDYANERLDRCPYKNGKPACIDCPIHCYNKIMREKIREIMRFSGPKMLFRHPYLALMHLVDEKKKKNGAEAPFIKSKKKESKK